MASYEDILERLLAHLEPLAGVGVEVSEDTHLVQTLGLDSTRVIDLLLDLEDEFDVAVPMDDLADVETVGDLAAAIHRRVEE